MTKHSSANGYQPDAPPADDVREALDHLDALNESGRIQYADYVALHDMVSRIEVRPRGTVPSEQISDAEVEAALDEWWKSGSAPDRMRAALEAAREAGNATH